MQAIEQALISFFERVAQRDERQLEKLRLEQRFSVEKRCWHFTLPDLYYFLQGQDDVFNRIGYKQFRHLIFDCPINQTVKLFGAEITITENRAKVDQSRYALVWQSEA
jgi:hypothetical protein